MTNKELIIFCAKHHVCVGCPYTKECKAFTDVNGDHLPGAAYPFLKEANKAWLESEVGEE